MDIAPPRLPLVSLLKRRPSDGVHRVVSTGGGRRTLRTVLASHRHQARVDHDMQAFRGHRLVGHRGHGHVRHAGPKRAHDHETLLDVAEISPTLALGGLAIHLSAKAVRTQLRHLNKTRIIIAAHPTPDTDQESTELWCFPWDTAIQRARPGKDPFARVFEYLHTSLYQQGVLVAPPRLVDGEELPEDHPLAPANIAQMQGGFLDPVTKFLPLKERS